MFKNLKIAALAAVISIGAFATAATATTITFSEAGATGNSFQSSDGEYLIEWVWDTGQANGHHHLNAGPDFYERGHGQNYQGLRISRTGAGNVTLTSFEHRGSWIVGLLNDGSGTTYSGGTQGSGAWTKSLVGLTASTVYIYTGGGIGGADMDNIVLGEGGTIPLPAALPMMAGGLSLLGLAGWRRKRKAA